MTSTWCVTKRSRFLSRFPCSSFNTFKTPTVSRSARELHCISLIDVLQAEFEALYSKHVRETIQAAELDPDIQKGDLSAWNASQCLPFSEYKRQKGYLERSVDVLKK